MKPVTRLLAVTALLAFASESAAVYTVDGQRKSFEIFRAEAAPVIDGRLDDDVWQHAAVDESNHLSSVGNELNVKVAYTFRY